jgi:hypothetical protein
LSGPLTTLTINYLSFDTAPPPPPFLLLHINILREGPLLATNIHIPRNSPKKAGSFLSLTMKYAFGLAALAALATASDVHDLTKDTFDSFVKENDLVLAECKSTAINDRRNKRQC